MRHYEVMIVLAPDQAEDGFNKQLERFKKIIEDGGGSVVNDDRWGIRSLAYPIKKYDQGFYTVIEWESTPDLLTELDHTLRLEENVLRHMVIHLDTTALEELAEMRAKRAERPSEAQIDSIDDNDGIDTDPAHVDVIEVDEPSESESKPDPEAGPDVEPAAVPDVEPEAVPDVEPAAVPDVEPEVVPDVEPEALESSESDASEESDPGDTGEVGAEEAEEEEK
ncbi:30S ribosomal protein S6 [Gemmatimonadota bacterium]